MFYLRIIRSFTFRKRKMDRCLDRRKKPGLKDKPERKFSLQECLVVLACKLASLIRRCESNPEDNLVPMLTGQLF